MKTQQLTIILLSGLLLFSADIHSQQWKINSNQWSATDALGRTLPTWMDAGDTISEKFIGLFYHTWHTDNLAEFDPVMNVTEILAEYPEAIDDFNHPAWQGITPGVFFWDEPLFGYYRTTDEWVLRKHAEMLADAGVDVVFCDVTNGNFTWKSSYTKLLEVWEQARKDGVKTPQFAFLLPFGATEGALESIYEIYTDLYEPKLHQDLWFMWKGKPLIMAYPETLNLTPPSDAAGMRFTASSKFTSIGTSCPSWANNIGNLTLSLYTWQGDYNNSVSREPVAVDTFINFTDNAYLDLAFDTLEAGEYVWELDRATEMVGVWKFIENTDSTDSYFNSLKVQGDYNCRIKYTSQADHIPLTTGSYETHVPVQIKNVSMDPAKLAAMKNFFTFRPGQPDYVEGPTRPDQWGWLEVYPQHGFGYKSGEGYEQATVGIAQNANLVSQGHCTSFNAPGTYGRSRTSRNGWDTREDSYLRGANFEEQWSRALALDPKLIWVTGWNEWTMGRYQNWEGCSGGPQVEVSFVDAFDKERSRDIEPVRSWGKFGDVYYYQLVDYIRQFKGMEKPEPVSEPKTIAMGQSGEWVDVQPQFWHYRGNTMERNHKGQGQNLVYTNASGRNDIVLAKVARDNDYLYFYVETDADLTSCTDTAWMRLFIDIDRDKTTGWEGYDYVINRVSPGNLALLESSALDWNWTEVDSLEFNVNGKVLELKVPKPALGLSTDEELDFEFKWSDNMQEDGNIMDFYSNGDVAPGGRFNFVYSSIVSVGKEEFKDPGLKSIQLKNFPNPFDNETTIEYNLPGSTLINISIYNSMGQKIRVLSKGFMPAGANKIVWNGCDENGNEVGPGVYFCRISSENRIAQIGSVIKMK